MTTLLDNLMDSLEVETIAAKLAKAETPQQLVTLWWEAADAYDGQARKLLQVAYQKRLSTLTGAGAS